MKRNLLMITALMLILAGKIYGQQSPSPFQNSNQTNFIYKIIDVAEHSYGYDVYQDGRLLIHQTTIPAMSGSKGFAKKQDAEQVAQLVIEKLKKGIMPPTITKEELQKLKIIP